MRGDLEALLGADRVLSRASDIVRYASDASPYRLLPRAVVMARDAGDVAATLAYGRANDVPVVFRAGGTSLSGQGQSDGILVDVRRHFGGVAVEEGGALARVKPGTVLGHANRVLAPHGRKLGPDPASTEIATVGGVIANNSGGMRCGVVHDSYSTLRSMTLVLPSGTTIDTAAPGAAERFASLEPELAEGLAAIRDEIRADAELSERIRRKFAIKNTTGYRLCAFLDAEQPLEIFRRLVVGSEGTLAFVAEAVFETVLLPARTTTAWVHFPGVDEAIAPVRDLVGCGATAVELMVAPALITAAYNMVGAPEEWKELPPESAVLLVEFGAGSDGELDAHIAGANEVLAGHETIRPIEFTREAGEIELAWRVREGLHGLVGRLRPPGTALIVEDVCVPPERIAEGARDLQALLGEHGFLPGVAGHASAGNLHFMLTPDFGKAEDLERYEALMSKLVELIVDKYDGSLKAEHGTGVNMAPYVEREWGEKATELMWRVKGLADPGGALAPGVVLNRDPGVHLRNLKTTPAIEQAASTCVECGFCEPVCPSRDLTTTPRQRIVLRREIARQPEGSPLRRALLDEYSYDGLDTCAADGSCRLACPLGIDTGELVKELRGERHGERAERLALAAAKRWGAVERALARGAAGRRAAGAADEARQGAARPGAGDASADAARGRRRRLRPLLHQPDLRGRPGSRAGRRLGPCRPPGLDPRRRRGLVLRAALELERLSGRPPPQGERGGRAALGVERRGGAAGGDRRVLLHPCRRRAGGGGAERGERRAARGAGDPRLGRLGARPPAAAAGGGAPRSARPPSTRPARPGSSGCSRACAGSLPPSPRTSTSRPRRPAAASPAIAASPTPS